MTENSKEYKNLTIRLSQDKDAKHLLRVLWSYLQLRNLILLLIKRNREEHRAQPEHRPDLFKHLSNPTTMRALLWQQVGGKKRETVDFLRQHYGQDAMFAEAVALGMSLKDKIITELMKQIQQSFRSFFALKKMGETRAREVNHLYSFQLPTNILAFFPSLKLLQFLRC